MNTKPDTRPRDMLHFLPVQQPESCARLREKIDDLYTKLLVTWIGLLMGWGFFICLLVMVAKHREADLRLHGAQSLSPVLNQLFVSHRTAASACAAVAVDRGSL